MRTIELNKIYNMDCIEGMKYIDDKSVDLTLTDIPYGEVNRKSNGLRRLDYGNADITTFALDDFLKEVVRVTKGSVYIFCGSGQYSTIFEYLKQNDFSVRCVVWEKTNPSPMNGQSIWLSGIELCVFGKRSGATYNGHCKNTVVRYPIATDTTIHPTMKPVDMFRNFVLTSSNENDIVLDPCMGSGTTALACIKENRNYIGFESCKEFYDKSIERIKVEKLQTTLF